MDKNEENEKIPSYGSSTKYDHLMRVSMEKNEENEKTSSHGSSTKYDYLMRLSMDKNEDLRKFHLVDHPQNTTILCEFLWTRMKI